MQISGLCILYTERISYYTGKNCILEMYTLYKSS